MVQTTYLTTDKLKDFTAISQNVDTSQLENFIPVAESMHIIPILGVALDSDLKTQIENGTLSGNNETLVVHIQNASAWLTFFEVSVFLRTKSLNKGVVQQFSDNSQVAPYEDFKQYRQSILDKSTFYTNFLIDYLDKNKSLFPLYRPIGGCDNSKKEYSGGIFV